MDPMPEDPTFAPFRRLGETLSGSFAARARGLLGSEFSILDRDGEEVGRLRIHGQEGAELDAGDLEARIERLTRSRYTMLAGGKEILKAASTPLQIRCYDHPYEARLSLFRNTAEAGPAGGEVTVRITGGLTNRSYGAVFDREDEGSLPVAFFLLYRIVALRREAYRTGPKGN
jgi:hypothetical protein